MSLKKAERKERFAEVILLLLKEQHEEAYNKLAVMCGEDTGLFFLADYKKTVEKFRAKKEAQLLEVSA